MKEAGPRSVALEYLYSGDPLPVPDLPGCEPESPEAFEYLSSIKERHYASLARTIDLVLAATLERPRTYHEVSGGEDSLEFSEWDHLRSDSLLELSDGIQTARHTAQYKETEEYTAIIGMLDPKRFHLLEIQLYAGAETAVSSTSMLLKNLPAIVSHHVKHGGMEQHEYGDIARRSIILPAQLALTCVNRMMAAQAALVSPSAYHERLEPETDFNPELFTLRHTRSGAPVLSYENFAGMKVPVGHSKEQRIVPAIDEQKIEEIECWQPKTVGCPVTLLRGRLKQLWEWQIAEVEARQLWESD